MVRFLGCSTTMRKGFLGVVCAGGCPWHSQSHAAFVCHGEGTGLCRQTGMCVAMQAGLGKMTIAWHIQHHLTA